MFVVFLGTGNALPSVERANTALVLMAAPGERAVLVDCGGDPYRNLARAGIDAERVSDLVITHAHIDHIGGLPSLIESFRIAGRRSPLHIYANQHALAVARDLLAAFAFELTLDRWPFAVELHELTWGESLVIGHFTVVPLPTEHTVPSLGLRFTPVAGGPTLAYTSDTKLAPALDDIARGADLFIAEATYPRGSEDAALAVRHLTITQAATVAQGARAKALALVHLSAGHQRDRAVRREARAAFRGEVILPRDGLVLEILQRSKARSRLP